MDARNRAKDEMVYLSPHYSENWFFFFFIILVSITLVTPLLQVILDVKGVLNLLQI